MKQIKDKNYAFRISAKDLDTIKNKKQTKGSMAGVLNYISDSNKIYYNDIPLRTGINCNHYSGFAEMCLTKKQYKKDDGRQFYQFVQ